jgi:hypothetical protein
VLSRAVLAGTRLWNCQHGPALGTLRTFPREFVSGSKLLPTLAGNFDRHAPHL